MCTLTIIPGKQNQPPFDGVRVVCNRDESRLRPVARPPELRQLGAQQTLMPVDPVSEGTWIGASDAGLVAVLMNVYISQAEPAPSVLPLDEPPVSRGTIIPTVLAAGDLDAAFKFAGQLNVSRFEPFRLILLDEARISETIWTAGMYAVGTPEAIAGPTFFTSSGLGDDLVARPRRELFEELVTAAADRCGAQDAFHRLQWPERRFASVWMTRPEARTQSITWVELDGQRVAMRYGSRIGESDELELAQAITLPIGQMPRDRAAGS